MKILDPNDRVTRENLRASRYVPNNGHRMKQKRLLWKSAGAVSVFIGGWLLKPLIGLFGSIVVITVIVGAILKV